MNALSPHKTGLVFGIFNAGCHAAWAALVASGAAAAFFDWVLWLHFLTVPVTVHSFRAAPALLLTALAFVSAYGMGWFFAWTWNCFTEEKAAKEVCRGKCG